jgi:thioredoxin 2
MEQDFLIIRCLKCGQKNRIDPKRSTGQSICGKCRSPLDHLIVQCFFCGAKNRISDDRLNDRPICARCRLPLYRSAPKSIDEAVFKDEVERFPGIVLVGCISDKTPGEYAAIWSYFASKYAGGIKVVTLFISESPSLKERFFNDESPALLIFCNGVLVKSISGSLNRDEIESELVSIMQACQK